MPEGQLQARSETRKLAAIMFTDIVGFSRQMGADEPRVLRLLETHNQLTQQAVADHHGHVIKTMGDAFLVEFPFVVHAVQCAQQIQAQLRTHNAEKESAEQIHIRGHALAMLNRIAIVLNKRVEIRCLPVKGKLQTGQGQVTVSLGQVLGSLRLA